MWRGVFHLTHKHLRRRRRRRRQVFLSSYIDRPTDGQSEGLFTCLFTVCLSLSFFRPVFVYYSSFIFLLGHVGVCVCQVGVGGGGW